MRKAVDCELGGQGCRSSCCLLSTHHVSATLCTFSLPLLILQAARQSREFCDLFKVKVTGLINGKAGTGTQVS